MSFSYYSQEHGARGRSETSMHFNAVVTQRAEDSGSENSELKGNGQKPPHLILFDSGCRLDSLYSKKVKEGDN